MVGNASNSSKQTPPADSTNTTQFCDLPVLKKIEYDVGSHIRCLKFHWSDDTISEKFGGFSLDKSYDFSDKDVGKIDVYKMNDQTCLSRMIFYDRDNTVLVDMKGSI
jgi:hypothetical protein